MHAVLLNLIVTGEIPSVTYQYRWLSMEHTGRLWSIGPRRDWANISIITHWSQS
jgi:hypothetical protein